MDRLWQEKSVMETKCIKADDNLAEAMKDSSLIRETLLKLSSGERVVARTVPSLDISSTYPVHSQSFLSLPFTNNGRNFFTIMYSECPKSELVWISMRWL